MQLLRFASIYKEAAVSANLHRWAAGIATQAFKQVMGRTPTPAERQIVMAVSNLESNYGKGWNKGKGNDSHNWGAIQTSNKKAPSFSHQDSSAQGKYNTKFKKYPDDISGAADVVRNLFKSNIKQRMPDPNNAYRVWGPSINGPVRSELIEMAAQQGDINAFSRAMWYTSYYEGNATDFTERMKIYSRAIQKNIDAITSALGEQSAWNQKSPGNFLPVTNDTSVINQISNMTSSKNINAPIEQKQQPVIENVIQKTPAEDTSLENLLWFQ